MICKKCQKEMPDVGDFCPFCGEPKELEALQAEEVTAETAAEVLPEEMVREAEEATEEVAEETAEEAPKKKKWPFILGIAGGAVLVLALIGLLVMIILNSLGIVNLGPKSDDVTYKASYTVEDDVALKKADKVVATMGGKELTNGELQLYYQNAVYTFYNQNYYYMSYMGLDLSQPLDQQTCMMVEGQTWEQYFLGLCLDSWEQYTLLNLMAEDEGFQVDQELMSALEGVQSEMEAAAEQYGYESVDAYIHDMAGPSVDLEDYLNFNRSYYTANDYLASFYENSYPTAQEIETYFAENEATFAESGITRDLGLQSSVRHILIAPDLTEAEGTEETDEAATAAQDQEAWDAALLEAQTLLDTWKAGEATEDSFAALVADNTDDTSSASTGGLYEGINADASYVPEFLAWSIDGARKPGDTEIVKTDYGYHIMYFVSGEDYWSVVVGEQLISERIKTALQQALEVYEPTYKYKNICLAQVDLM